MILQALTDYYEDLVNQGRIARPGWAKAKISYALAVDEAGALKQVIPLYENIGKKKPQPQQFDMPAPVKRTVGIVPNFLWDNSSYLLGVDNKEKDQEQEKENRSVSCFKAAKELHHSILDGIESVTAKGILSFFDCWDPQKAAEQPALAENWDSIISGTNLTFRVNGVFAYEDELIRNAWQEYYDKDEGEIQQCLVTGKDDVIAAVHPSIKGVDGAQSSGAAIVSFNAQAFCSYGQEQSYNAPVGKYAAFAYTSALNYLLSDRENVQKIGDASVVCWAEGAEQQYQKFTFAALFGSKDDSFSEADLRAAVKKIANGESIPEQKLNSDKRCYILGLSPNAARISVRFFYQDTFGNLMKNIYQHYERMEIVRPSYDSFTTIPLWELLLETTRSNSSSDVSPVLAGAVARSIFTGGLYPAALIEQIQLRVRANHQINRGKAAIIKAYYLRNTNADCPKEVLTVALNEQSTNPAYILGRLFSVYEALQEAANPGINSTIKDKYFNSASATPALIFPVLNNLSQKHLRKLDDGKRIWYERQIMFLKNKIQDEYPTRFNLPQQGAFDLGYYHQTQKRYEKKEEK